jgi:hypothetical protein
MHLDLRLRIRLELERGTVTTSEHDLVDEDV